MKISYRREMKHNYMIVDPEALIWRNYECRMLTANTMEGVLHFQIRQIDDEIRFYYEITSKQPLSRLLENQNIGTEEIRMLLLGISAVLDRMEIYLLRESCIMLDPDQIYVDPESFRIWLCLVPGLEQDFPEKYGKLLEYLLGKVDHQDKNSVVLAYGLYQETRKENYGMEDILRLLYAGQEKLQPQQPQQPQSQQPCNVTTQSVVRPEASSMAQTDTKPDPVRSGQGIWSRIREWWNKRRQTSESQEMVQVSWDMMFQENSQDEEERMPGERAMNQDTVLLADLSPQSGERQYRLHALDPDLEDIVLSYYPFVIGKQENMVDYLLAKDTVSRLHLRIDREGDHYYVQDLNSTNGTMVNGILLDNNETAELHAGAEICIAKHRYCFE